MVLEKLHGYNKEIQRKIAANLYREAEREQEEQLREVARNVESTETYLVAVLALLAGIVSNLVGVILLGELISLSIRTQSYFIATIVAIHEISPGGMAGTLRLVVGIPYVFVAIRKRQNPITTILIWISLTVDLVGWAIAVPLIFYTANIEDLNLRKYLLRKISGLSPKKAFQKGIMRSPYTFMVLYALLFILVALAVQAIQAFFPIVQAIIAITGVAIVAYITLSHIAERKYGQKKEQKE
jgi:hypothetical protein